MNDVAIRFSRSTWRRMLLATLAVLAMIVVVSGGVLLAEQGQPRQAASSQAAPDYGAILNRLEFRELGPAIMGGRIDDFAVVESDPRIVYAGLASGGVWKTVDAGTTWTPIFENEEVSTIGDVTLAPSDPNIVWVGTGEPNNRQSSSWGNGVYRSLDGGGTWQHMGLRETNHIGRIVIHPTNPNIVYVAALGKLWGANRERGVYKSTDGGRTWTNVLFINEDTGVVDIAMNPDSPDTLLAAAYQRRRTVWGFNGGGPHGGIYKTTDGGANWKKLERGLPWDPNPRRAGPGGGGGGGGFGGGGGGAAQAALQALLAQQLGQQDEEPPGTDIGRIGLNFYRRNGNIVYALVEHAQGGIYRSEDAGETWTKMSNTNPRPMYYSKVHIDPNNDLRIWVLGAPLYHSEDGGKTFAARNSRIHVDFHAFWINPANSTHMIVGSDGGITWTYDSGRTWDFVNTLAIGQFYEVGVNMEKPYTICGGLQDNGSWCGPSATLFNVGPSNDEWRRVGGGDGFFVQMDWSDPDILYSESQDGNLNRRRVSTGESKSIRPREEEGAARYRFQWNSPIVVSRHDPKVIYYGGNFVFRSPNRGDSWETISPDLTNGVDRLQLEIFGKKPDRTVLSRNDGVRHWPTITTLSESPRNAAILWAGTDDGNLQVTRDGGKNWKNVTGNAPGLAKGAYVTRVQASHHADCTAYATFDGHRMDDFSIYVFATTNCGDSWTAIRNGIPDNRGVANVIREHHKNPDLLFVGTEYGAYVSFDRGANWTRIKMNLPTVPVDDILIHPRDNDLIFGTHGRAIWVLDDIAALEGMNATVANSDMHLFDVRPGTMWRRYQHKGNTGHKIFIAQNPPNGATIYFHLKNKPEPRQRVRISILDSSGRAIRDINVNNAEAGVNRAVWDFRENSPIPPAQPGQAGGGGRGGGFFGGGAGPRVDPGEYTVRLSVGSTQQTKKITVEEDPRITLPAADRAERRAALTTLGQLARRAVTAQRGLVRLRAAVNNTLQAWRRPGAPNVPDSVRKAVEDYLKQIDEVYPNFANIPQGGGGLGFAGPPLAEQTRTPITNRINQLRGAIENFAAPLTANQKAAVPALEKELGDVLPKVRPVMDGLAPLNKLINDAGVPHINVPQPTRQPGAQRPPEEEEGN